MTRSDIPFATDDAHRFLPWLIGIMVGMVMLMLCIVVSINSWIGHREHRFTASFTVSVPETHQLTDEKKAQLAALLKALPPVSDVSELSETKLKDMLKPWLGDTQSFRDLPLPVVYDVTLDPKKDPLDMGELQQKLDALAPGIEIDSTERWIETFTRFSHTLQWLISMLAVLLIGAMGLMIAFTSRASLKLHARTVHLLHSIGAEDDYITRQFQQEVGLLVLRGAIAGCLIAAMIYASLGFYMQSLDVQVLPSLALTARHVILMVMMPLVCALVALMAARIAVSRHLHSTL